MDAESTTLLIPYHAYGATHGSTGLQRGTHFDPGRGASYLAEGARAAFFHLGAWLKILAVKCACDGEPERRVVAVQLTEGKGP